MFLPMDGDVLKKIAAGVGFTCLLFAATLYIPIIGFISVVAIPLPVSYYRYKLGRSAGGLILAISCIVMTIMTEGLSFDLALFAMLLVLGFVLGEMLDEGASVEKTVLYPCLSVIGSGVALALFYSAFGQTALSSLVNLYVKQNLELTLELYRQMSMPEETLQTLSRSLETIQYVLVRIIPGMAVMSTLFVTWVNLLLTRSLVRFRGLKTPDFGSLTQWKSPEVLVWVVIAGGVLLMIPVKSLKIIGLNIVIALIMIYFIQGISIVSFYFDKRKFPRILRWVLYGLIGVQQLFSLLVIGLGFFDLWIDFRKINKNEKLNSES
ncbi:MAG: YybS family protein [Deltaproteobacteria bacterium]|nr:YybS family protein [Deltaproteobacteria bacterium]